MPTIVITERKSLRLGKGSATIELKLPDAVVDLLDPQAIARLAAERQQKSLQDNLTHGRDAHGEPYSLDARTVKIRQYNRQPPGRVYAPRVRKTKSGKISKRKRQPWYPKRFPEGGSQGGSTAFVDSGHLTRNLTIDVQGNSAFVSVPAARVAAVNAFAVGAYGGGGKRPLPVLALDVRKVDDVTEEVIDAALFPSGGGGRGRRFFR